MKLAFLILTYGNTMFPDKIKLLEHNNNIYIHPKYPDQIDEYFSKFIIDNIIETKWGDMSLVSAAINLLKSAYDKYDYYFLISGDTYPLYSYDELMEKLKNNKLSIFDEMDVINEIHKTSQWWMISNDDAKVIINTEHKYKNYFTEKMIRNIGAYDECYFLTVLNKEVDNYKFNNMKCVYVKWLQHVITKHPFTFNKLTKEDINDIEQHNSFFVRKCLTTLNKYEKELEKTLYIIYIGSHTDQNNILNNILEIDDISIITSLDIDKINENILRKCFFIVQIIWKFYVESIIDLYITHKQILKQWNSIIFIPEKYTFKNIKYNNKLVSVDAKSHNFLRKLLNKNIINKKIFVEMIDDENNIAYVLLNKYL